MVVPSFKIGVLGCVGSALVTVFFNSVGLLTVCFFSIFGAAFGLRQMVLSRFWFGWWRVKLSTNRTVL
jgi:purine-cytosine permease-like protein